MNQRFRWLAIPVLVAGLVIAGCSDSDESTTETPTPSATTDAAGSSGAADSTAAPSDTNDDVPDMATLAARIEGGTFSVLYNVGASTVDGLEAGTWKWTQDGSRELLRFDIEADGESATMIMGPDDVTICAEGACFGANGTEGALPDVSGVLSGGIESDDPTGTVTRGAPQTIAGVETECFDYVEDTGDAAGTICFSPENVPLLIDATTADGNFSMVAESYTAEVAEGDFEPPFPVTSLGNMGGMGGTGPSN